MSEGGAGGGACVGAAHGGFGGGGGGCVRGGAGGGWQGNTFLYIYVFQCALKLERVFVFYLCMYVYI